ncbi:pyridoxine/pyridoxamine 5'-phosphate oxidase [Gordonia sp. CPCC 205333]|uniref:pyridoxine/pyridoxamine 5'-phosphate oxidase n=1 Tax=Gordonia sp. CPCC 205333 TaxID=3140790 RepID=UPI003AF4066A
MAQQESIRSVLRGLPVLAAIPPEFDLSSAPDDPISLFSAWFRTAVEAGVREPHAMTLSTTDSCGVPDARVLILKDIDADGWHFAISTASRKGAELAANPFAALTFYWSELVRQVRIRGQVTPDRRAVSEADFRARSNESRALALTRRQSQAVDTPTDLDEAVEKAHRDLQVDPDLVPAEWVSYAVRPQSVEFWQADSARRHRRLNYERAPHGWTRSVLWP